MEAADSVPEVSKRKKVRWEYVVEPLNKATYWDHAALSAEERRSKAKRVFLVAETKEQLQTVENNTIEVEDNPKSQKKLGSLREPASAQAPYKGVRCAERGGTNMLLWQYEFYYVLKELILLRLGMNINSAAMMWETVESVFEGVRRVMRDNGRAAKNIAMGMWSA